LNKKSKTQEKKAGISFRYLISLFVVNLIHFMSFFSLRDKRIWVFGSWDGEVFIDNSKAMFIISQRLSNIKPIWVSRNRSLVNTLRAKGFSAYYIWEIRAIYYGLRARYFFIDHSPFQFDLFSPTNLWLSGGAKIVNFWHGIPLKRIDEYNKGHDSFFESILSHVNLVNKNFNSYAVAPSMLIGRIICSALKIPEENLIQSAYPRNILSLNQENNFSIFVELNEKIKKFKASGGKVIFYIPTFRDYSTNPFSAGLIDLKKLQELLDKNNCLLVTKFHQVDNQSVGKLSERFIFLPNGFDLYEILYLGDVLITDYSSIFFDFLLFNRPIVFFAYDLERYKKYSRELYFDYEKFVPGEIVHTSDELLNLVAEILENRDDNYQKRRLDLASDFFHERQLLLKNILVDY
jgi:CDP-glycerol glycerophosphotransferase (TagB/SpsB family)